VVITKLYGGLGNQMFQYAAGLALSEKLKSAYYLDLKWFEEIKTNREVTQRVYELNGFEIYPSKLSVIEVIRNKLNPPLVFKERDLNYQPAFEHLEGDVILDGYWQSHKYFQEYEETVVNAFRFPEEISKKNGEILDRISATNSVSIHIRRGDYNTKVGRNYHGLVPLDYYEQALASLKKNTLVQAVFVFSDDIEWCKKNVSFKPSSVFIDSNGPSSGVEDMRLMSACKYNILANSSFSWWAAWLNRNPNKVVYAPKVWFKGVEAKIDDRLPLEWVRL